MLPTPNPAAAFVLAILVAIWLVFRVCRGHHLKLHTAAPYTLPPGPSPLFWLGNPFHVHRLSSDPRKETKLLHAKYGELVTLWLGATPLVLINSPDAAHEILTKQASATYSRSTHNEIRRDALPDRLVLETKKTEINRLRKVYHPLLGQPAEAKFSGIHGAESAQLLRALLDRPGDFMQECDRFAINVLLQGMYNARLGSDDDVLLKHVYGVWGRIYTYFLPGSTVLDFFPSLLLIPRWLQPWHWLLSALRRAEELLHKDQLEQVRKQGDAAEKPGCPNFASNLLSKKHLVAESSDHKGADARSGHETCNGVRDDGFLITTLAVALGAGSDTTSAVLQLFFKTMALHPRSVAMAKSEIDAIVGSDRLPALSDEAKLPYTTALIKEVNRWAPIAVVGLPHAAARPVQYRHYTLPAGTILVPNILALSRSPSLFRDPDVFDPHRFLPDLARLPPLAPTATHLGASARYSHVQLEGSKEAQKPEHFQYGFGLRKCPGERIANSALFLAIARIIWAFDILPCSVTPEAAESGMAELDMTRERAGLVKKPLPFRARITCRKPNCDKLVEEELRRWDGLEK